MRQRADGRYANRKLAPNADVRVIFPLMRRNELARSVLVGVAFP
jgi:hypothetical protein